MTRRTCWCGHDKSVHADTGCVSCRSWRKWLQPVHLYRPITSLKPMPRELVRS